MLFGLKLPGTKGDDHQSNIWWRKVHHVSLWQMKPTSVSSPWIMHVPHFGTCALGRDISAWISWVWSLRCLSRNRTHPAVSCIAYLADGTQKVALSNSREKFSSHRVLKLVQHIVYSNRLIFLRVSRRAGCWRHGSSGRDPKFKPQYHKKSVFWTCKTE
jgi:hypothetical protein